VIDFNTASGKQDIQIPLTDIFNPNNYYTKSETSGATEIATALAQKLAISDFNTYSGTVDTLINSKASQSDLDALNGVVTAHTADTTVHVTTSDKTKWNKVDDKLDVTDFNTYSGTVETALAQKQNQLVAGENITISGNVISSEGGGKAIEAGRGIAITTGETADTVSFNLPIYAGTGENSIIIGDERNISSERNSVAEGRSTSATTQYAHSEGSRTLASGSSSHAEGSSTTASGNSSHAEGSRTSATSDASHSEGYQTSASGEYSHSEGQGTLASGSSSHAEGRSTSATTVGAHSEGSGTLASGQYSHSEGSGTTASGKYSHAEGSSTTASGNSSHAEGISTSAMANYSHSEGENVNATNQCEHSQGRYNVSNKANTTWGDSGNTLFSVGNGTSSARHNAFEIRQNGDIYITKDGSDVKLQDQLGSGGGTVESAITSGSTNAVESKAIWSAVTYDVSINETLEFDNTYAATNYPSGCNSVTFERNDGAALPPGDYVFTSGGSEVAKLTCAVISWWPVEISWTSSDPKLTYVVAEGNTAVTASYSELASDIDGVTVTSAFTTTSTATASGENHLWINENTYRKDEVYNKSEINVLSGVIDTKLNTISGAVDTKLDATAYTPTIVDSALSVTSSNPVQNKALYNELRIVDGGVETETVLEWDGSNTTNYPEGCTKIKVEVDTSETTTTSSSYFFYNGDEKIGGFGISVNDGEISVTISIINATYEISGSTVIISYPTVTNVTHLISFWVQFPIKAVTITGGSVTTLRDQVVANTTAIAANTTALGGKVDTSAITTSVTSSSTDAQVPSAKAVNDKLGGLSLVQLTQAEYDALATKDNNTLYVIVG
jgi:hypothetical protein